MVYKELYLADIEPKLSDSKAMLRIYISDCNETINSRPGLLVLPGGGYGCVSPREAEPVAFRFLSEGFNCFILEYSTFSKYPVPHLEVAVAMNYIRSHEKEFDLISNSFSIIGFSAGGHLAGTYGYLYPELAKKYGYDDSLIRPQTLLLCYPVTLLNEYTHKGTMDIITGGEELLKEKLNIPTHISKNYPPTFAFATKDDEMVPVENTEVLKEALENNHVKNRCLIYESGRHGVSMVNRSVYYKQDITNEMKEIRDWASLASNFVFEIIDDEN